MKKNRKYKKIKIIMVFTTVLLIAFVAVVGLYKTGIYRFDFFKDVYKKIDFQLSTNELNIPQDALSFSVYDIEQGEYLFYEGDSQLPTVASLAKLFVIDYALTKVNLEDVIEVNQEVLDLVPAGSSLANLKVGKYTVKEIMEAMLVPSGNDAAYSLAYYIAKNELGEGYTATEYINYFMTELSEYLIEEGYSKTNLYNDPSGAVSIDESGDTSPLHTSDILYFNDKKSFTVETLHRLLLQKWTNRLKQLFVFQIIYSRTKPVGTLAPTGFYFVKN